MKIDAEPAQGGGYRFGGHQSFALRFPWLPKAVAAIEAGEDVFTDPVRGVVDLGLGKNMVEALRCWIEAYGVASRQDAWALTPEGEAIFGTSGRDPFLEDVQTMWWLHWTISTAATGRFFAWEYLVNRSVEPTFTPSGTVAAFLDEAERTGRRLSPVSARQHFDVWLHTYLPSGSGRGEDGLDSPLASLRLVALAGEREATGGRREPMYAFDRLPKRGLGQGMFRYALSKWWDACQPDEETAPLREIAFAKGGPGQVFRLSEHETFARLEDLAARPEAGFELRESNVQTTVRRVGTVPVDAMLRDVYGWRDAPVAGMGDA
ncbi:DUF4007 family protein [Sphingomonas panni]|uniref:DUF4007 family protein n=1 Tax=Sphingomonas panni TaxID=237612 RepID=UPI001F5B7D2E|nr:DUF4007 family protein [Sphingomonas panni]